jgi:cold-inducible RNA-binding protein
MGKIIYVGNLSFAATESELRKLFEAFGPVRGIQIIQDRETGRSRGFAFVEMDTNEGARAAIEALNNAEIAGRAIVVNETRERETRRADRPRAGYGSGGGGGRHSDASLNDDAFLPHKPEGPARSHRSIRVELFIGDAGIEDDEARISELRTSILETLDAIGFELDPVSEAEEEFGSWWARFLFRSKMALTSDEMIDIYTETREAIRRKAIDDVGADIFSKRATAVEKLLARLDQFDEVAFRLGDVLIVKANMAGKVRVIVETMSHQLQRTLDDDPMLMRDPISLLTYIKDQNQTPPQIAQPQDITKR